MDNPVDEISHVIHTLTSSSPTEQQNAVYRYFTPNAQFTHPFCKTGTFTSIQGFSITSRWVILQIYRWYKILSPRIDLSVKSIAFDEANMLLYVTMNQHFRLFFVPAYDADVWLTTVLKLTHDENGKARSRNSSPQTSPRSNGSKRVPKGKYYIEAQNDLYQTSEFIKFLVPWNIGLFFVVAWQLFATLMCVVGAVALYPITYFKEQSIDDAQ